MEKSDKIHPNSMKSTKFNKGGKNIMYEETKRIDWKGIFLKVIILFLIILIIFKGYSLLRGKNNTEKVNTETNVVNTQSKIFVENLSKLDEAAKKYFEENKLE